MMKITKENIIKYAQKYNEWYKGTSYEIVEKKIKKWLKSHRYLDKRRFLDILNWKLSDKRPLKKAEEKNSDGFVKKITKLSFSSKNERERIECLLGSKGGLKEVGYPVASAILHFAFPNKYPILDVKALWSLGGSWKERGEKKNYNFDFWQRYCDKIRSISEKTGENIRTIDKALWQYSKENQKKTTNYRELKVMDKNLCCRNKKNKVDSKNFEESKKYQKQLFWEQFIEKARLDKLPYFNKLERIRIGDNGGWICEKSTIPYISFCLVATTYNARIEIFINSRNEKKNQETFYYFKENKKEIEETFGHKLRWRDYSINNKGRMKSRIIDYEYKEVNIIDKSDWGNITNSFLDGVKKMDKAFRKHILKLNNG